jgi:hypothetical protein
MNNKNNDNDKSSPRLTARYLTTRHLSNRLVTGPHRSYGLMLQSLRIVSHRPLAVSHRPRALSHRPRAVSHRPRAASHHPHAMSHHPHAVSHHPHAVSHRPRAVSHRPRAVSHRPRGVSHHPHVIAESLQCPGMMLQEFGNSDLRFRYVPRQEADAHVPTTHATLHGIYSYHGPADHAGISHKSSHGPVRAGATVRILQIPCLGLTI